LATIVKRDCLLQKENQEGQSEAGEDEDIAGERKPVTR
jgi:hypothetical protein